MNEYKAKLIGELVGLARATDGNEHLISEHSTSVIRNCLAALPACDADLAAFLRRVEEAKRAMVPDCFLCANPCGKTAAFDLSELDKMSHEQRESKQKILDRLLNSAAEAPAQALYRGLIALGMGGLTPEFLNSVAEELNP